jgi:hypothetical protein
MSIVLVSFRVKNVSAILRQQGRVGKIPFQIQLTYLASKVTFLPVRDAAFWSHSTKKELRCV